MSNLFVTPWTVAHQTPLSKVLQARILELVAISFSSGLFLIQGLNPCLLHWQVDSLPVNHLGSPSQLSVEDHFNVCLSGLSGHFILSLYNPQSNLFDCPLHIHLECSGFPKITVITFIRRIKNERKGNRKNGRNKLEVWH